MQASSNKPYLLRAHYEWCTDNHYTPYILVHVDSRTRVPKQFVQKGEIVLNISPEATHQLKMSNDWIEFSARFSGIPHKIEIPVRNVLAIYAQESGEGMHFPLEEIQEEADLSPPPTDTAPHPDTQSPSSPSKPDAAKGSHLKIIK
jgi:stringent starvation protein B